MSPKRSAQLLADSLALLSCLTGGAAAAATPRAGRVALRAALLACALAASAAAAGRAEDPTCAVLAARGGPFDVSPAAALLEAELAERGDVRLVERGAVERLLAERSLTLAFSPEGAAERAAIGRTIKADLLVLLGARAGAAPHVEVVVCETALGLRLSAERVAWRDDPEALAREVALMVDAAVRKRGEGAAEIAAVSPFISLDLTHERDYLKSAYARVIERMLLGRRGIVVAELEEARAIARELELAGDSLEVKRRVPLCFLGEYRTGGTGDGARLSLAIELRRGAKRIGRVEAGDVPEDEAAERIRGAVRELLEAADVGGEIASDPAAEAEAHAARAREFARLGFWKEALELVEASLLLRRDQPDLRRLAVEVTSDYVRAHCDSVHGRDVFVRKAVAGLALYDRGMEHLDMYLRARVLMPDVDLSCVEKLCGAPRGFSETSHRRGIQEIVDLTRAVVRRRYELVFRTIECCVQAGLPQNHKAYGLCHYALMDCRYLCGSIEEAFEERLRLIGAFLRFGGPDSWIVYLAQYDLSRSERSSPEYRRFVEGIGAVARANGGERDIRVAKMLLDEHEELLEAKRNPKPGRESPPRPKEEIRFDGEARLQKLDLHGDIRGWIACGGGVDIAYGLKTLYLVRGRDEVDCLMDRTDEVLFHFIDPRYDGRYVWALVVRSEPLLVVVEPGSGKVMEFTAKDGLPPANVWVAAAALGPGRAVLAGCFEGSDPEARARRTWCALAELGPDGRLSLDVFLEATRQPAPGDADAWRDPHTVFGPGFMETVWDPRAPDRKYVILQRCMRPILGDYHPLIIDPSSRSVRITDRQVRIPETDLVVSHEGSVYWVSRGTLYRLGCPGFRVEKVRDGFLSDAKLAFAGGSVHVLGERFWRGRSLDGDFETLKIAPRWGRSRLRASNHYGLLLVILHDGVYEVKMPPARGGP